MTERSYVSSKPCHWVSPRTIQNASMRFKTHGRVQPMEYDEPGFFARLFRRGK